ncbi:hypothetical protein [Streptomyces sp. NBC_00696]|uniref:hypothetical protein n=1 Tax=Streptomyces sp. NBC_00696 TaxID=2903672 RepID=UPI002E34CD1F|nr:hypothetical protein [Streptomyces sp. NBC_00696]
MISLVLSIIALCVGIANLTWQLALFLLNGPRISVQMKIGAVGRGGMASTPVENVQHLEQQLLSLREQGFGEPVLAIEVVNTGRLGVELLSYGAELSSGISFAPVGEAITETPMPYFLEPHRQATWAMPLSSAVRVVEATKAAFPKEDPGPVRMYVRRAGGKAVYAKRSLRL